MGPLEITLLIAIGIWLIFAVRSIIKNKGGCSCGCDGCKSRKSSKKCTNCKGCDNCDKCDKCIDSKNNSDERKDDGNN